MLKRNLFLRRGRTAMSSSAFQPEVVRTIPLLRQRIGAARKEGLAIGLVPTMGALHEGHLSLVRASQAECGLTVASIYVNPSQFGPKEDYRRYPRDLEKDLDMLGRCGQPRPVVFSPTDEEMYPQGFTTWVEVGGVAEPWEGSFRPGHFRGVATVVLKLLNIVLPDKAYFGQKDYQQVAVIGRLVRDLDVPVAIRVQPTVREPDGLAMSSRNTYLSPPQRQQALVLWKSLCLARDLADQGERDPGRIVEKMREIILSVPEARIDYIALADPDTLAPVREIRGRTLAAVAVHMGGTRLIDNCLFGS
jgi:pantoate--beta-alanine ligase